MSTPDSNPELRAVCREVTLCLLGMAQLYDLNAAAMAATARALGAVFGSHLPDLVVPPLGRKRTALMLLADALRAEGDRTTDDERTPVEKETDR